MLREPVRDEPYRRRKGSGIHVSGLNDAAYVADARRHIEP
jgi:hypothetical protein